MWHPDLLQEDLSTGSTTADGASSNGGTTFLEEQPPPPPLWHSDPSFHGLNPDTAMGTTDGAEVSSTETLATNPSPPAALPELWAPRKFAPQGFSAREAMPALGAPVTVLKNNPQAYGKLWPRAGLGPVPSSSSWSAADSSSSSSALFAFFGGSSGSMFPSAATTMNGNWADVLVPCALTSGIAIVLWAYWKVGVIFFLPCLFSFFRLRLCLCTRFRSSSNVDELGVSSFLLLSLRFSAWGFAVVPSTASQQAPSGICEACRKAKSPPRRRRRRWTEDGRC